MQITQGMVDKGLQMLLETFAVRKITVAILALESIIFRCFDRSFRRTVIFLVLQMLFEGLFGREVSFTFDAAKL